MSSENIQCEQCKIGHKDVVPLRIFLSYGHDANEPLVLRIKDYLEYERGHTVWIDKEQLKEGDEWRDNITKGILESDGMLAFLSEHSVRTPGVCRDEISIALGHKTGFVKTILVESEKTVEPPASVSHIQWFDFQEWKSHESDNNEEWLDERLEKIAIAIEDKENRAFSGDITKLNKYLHPKENIGLLQRLLKKRFCGRKTLIKQIKEWNSQADSKLCWLRGAPGIGKSALSAFLVHYGGSNVIAAHFCDWRIQDQTNPAQIVRNIAFQLATRLPDYRRLLCDLPGIDRVIDSQDANGLFISLIVNNLQKKIDGHHEHYMIIIDALDEGNQNGGNPISEMLMCYVEDLPSWIKILVTSRPEPEVEGPMLNLKNLCALVLEPDVDENYSDIKEYLEHALGKRLTANLQCDQIVDLIYKKSEGIFLYVEYVCEVLQGKDLSIALVNELPQGLYDFYFDNFKRYFEDVNYYKRNIRAALSVMGAVSAPISNELLCRILDWDEFAFKDFKDSLGSIIKEDNGRLVPCHKSVFDWLSDSRSGLYQISIGYGHRTIADKGWDAYMAKGGLDAYYLRHLVSHFVENKSVDRLLVVAIDEDFLPSFIQQIWQKAGQYINHSDTFFFDFISNNMVDELFANDKHDSLIRLASALYETNCYLVCGEILTRLSSIADDAIRIHALIIEAKILLATGHIADSGVCLQKALKLCSSEHTSFLFEIYWGLGLEQHDLGHYNEEYTYLKQALDLLDQDLEKGKVAAILHQMGSVFSRQGNFTLAKDYYTDSMNFSLALGNQQAVLASKHELAGVVSYLGDYGLAISYLDEEASFAGNGVSLRCLASSYYEKGKILTCLGAIDKAMECLEKGREIFVSVQDVRGQSLTCVQRGRAYLYNNEPEKARLLLEEGNQLANANDYARAAYFSLLYLLKVHVLQDNAKAVEDTFVRLGEMLPQFDDDLAQCYYSSALGKYHFYRGEFAEAIKAYERYKNISIKISYVRGLAYANLLLFSVYVAMQCADENIHYLHEARQLMINIKDLRGMELVQRAKDGQAIS